MMKPLYVKVTRDVLAPAYFAFYTTTQSKVENAMQTMGYGIDEWVLSTKPFKLKGRDPSLKPFIGVEVTFLDKWGFRFVLDGADKR
jgi:hypothetical protein